MSGGLFLRVVVRVAASLFFAGVFYAAWLAAFIPLSRANRTVIQMGLWVAAPFFTAAGFAVGSLMFRWREGAPPQHLLRAFGWPLVGCAVGAAVVFPFGPMLIVFGMFSAGTAAVAVHEFLLARRDSRN